MPLGVCHTHPHHALHTYAINPNNSTPQPANERTYIAPISIPSPLSLTYLHTYMQTQTQTHRQMDRHLVAQAQGEVRVTVEEGGQVRVPEPV